TRKLSSPCRKEPCIDFEVAQHLQAANLICRGAESGGWHQVKRSPGLVVAAGLAAHCHHLLSPLAAFANSAPKSSIALIRSWGSAITARTTAMAASTAAASAASHVHLLYPSTLS